MVEEVAAIVLELHQGGGRHANTTRCQHEAEASTSDRERKGEQGKRRGIIRGRHHSDMIRQYIVCFITHRTAVGITSQAKKTLSMARA